MSVETHRRDAAASPRPAPDEGSGPAAGSSASDPYRELFERSADAILIIDGEKFVDCNQATVDMLRYQNKQELLQTHPSELSPEQQPDGRLSFEKANEMIARAFERGSHRFEWDHKRADGEVFPVEVLLTAVPKGDRQILHCVWRDITDRKQLEIELRQAQKMEAVGKLAGGIAHDFNNMLVAILGHSELLEMSLPENDPLREDVVEIRRAGERAADLVSQLLAFSRKQVLRVRVIDLNEVVRNLGHMLGRLIGEDVSLQVDLAEGPLKIEADPGRIEQVILNLVTNARDAMPKGGALEMATLEVEIGSGGYVRDGEEVDLPPGRYAKLSVLDTGEGIATDVLDKIFDPFFTTRREGTGLGLATAFGIVKQSGGDFSVSTLPGAGTEFRVYLPVTDALLPVDGPEESPTRDPERRSDETILLVEDEPLVATLMKRLLREAGYEVHAATSAHEALDLVNREGLDFDLLLTDVVMPDMKGPELACALLHHKPDLRVLYASGYTDDALMEKGTLEAGVDLISKPFSRADLLERVRSVLDRPLG